MTRRASTAGGSRRSRRTTSGTRLRLAALTVSATIALTACMSGGSTGSAETTANTLRVVAPDSTLGWAPDNGAPSHEAQINTQATLLRKPYVKSSKSDSLQQDVNTFDGYLASGYKVSDDGRTYTFTLKDAISAAGNHLTADDVIYSFTRKFESPKGNGPAVWTPVITSMKQFKKIDDHKVSITVANPGYGTTLLALLSDRTTQIYDSKLLKQHATDKDPYAVVWSSENPNHGFGPYKVKSDTPGVQVVLEANPKFVLGAPKIKNISIKIVADAGTRANAVRNNQADLAENLLPADMTDLKSSASGVKLAAVDSPNQFIMIPLVTNKAPFNNTAVRQAFAYAVPYQKIIDNVYHGLAQRDGPSFLRSDAPGYDGSGFTDFTYDPQKAKAMLADAGFGSGVSFTLTVSAAAPDMQQAAIQIQTYAKAAGFDVKINQQPDAAITAGRAEGTFQAWVLRDSATTLTPSYELGIYTGKDSPNNLAKWGASDFYAAKTKADAEADPTTKAAGKAFNATERILINQAPIVFIAQIQPDKAMRSTVDGFAWRSDNQTDFSAMSLSSAK
ncbi:ABC transporter substrate-binding protein [Streptomyces phaeochromogenes]|uniref:ABC transporter substrate-binding protein n=1 Tax=Streptomyces phaeochromogenes TaxID=1923 RepID=UPI0036CD46F7